MTPHYPSNRPKNTVLALIAAVVLSMGLTARSDAGKLCRVAESDCGAPTATPTLPDGKSRIIVSSDYFRCADGTYACRVK